MAQGDFRTNAKDAGTAVTTDTTTATLCSIGIDGAVDSGVYVKAWAHGTRTDSNADAYMRELRAYFKNSASGLTEPVAEVQVAVLDQGASGYTVTIDNSGDTIRLRVTGAGTDNVAWAGEMEVRQVETGTITEA